MSAANGCAAKQATPAPRQQDVCGEAPREEFLLYSSDIPLIQQTFHFEGDVRHAAEVIARSHRGAGVTYAKVIATVREPLLALEWTDGREAGSGQNSGGIMGLGPSNQKAATDHEYRNR